MNGLVFWSGMEGFPALEGAQVQAIAGKGNGVRATRDLRAGHVVLRCTAWATFIDEVPRAAAACA